jgi:hypothetical protein
VIEATNSPLGFRDAVRASRIGGRVVLAGIPDDDTYTLSASDARRRGLKNKFVRRMGDDYRRAIDLVSSDRVNVRALVTHRESLNAAPELFEALAQNRPGDLKALLYPDEDGGCQAIAAGAPPASSTNRSASSARNGSLGAGPRFRNTSSTKIARRAFKRRLAARKANSICL